MKVNYRNIEFNSQVYNIKRYLKTDIEFKIKCTLYIYIDVSLSYKKLPFLRTKLIPDSNFIHKTAGS